VQQSEVQPDDWTIRHEMTMLRNENSAMRQCVCEPLRIAHTYAAHAMRDRLQSRLMSLRGELARTGRLPGSLQLTAPR
jgi:hypothetical protein